MKAWCKVRGYDGVTKECIMNAFNSSSDEVHKMAKREKLKGVIKDG